MILRAKYILRNSQVDGGKDNRCFTSDPNIF